MAETKWTVGPYEVRRERDGGGWKGISIVAPGRPGNPADRHLANIVGQMDDSDLANARLIAAAPALYEALAEAVTQIEYLHAKFKPTGSGEAVLSRARAALKDAAS